ncbi:MAG TPA: DNA polymerase III subunit delta [Chitinophagaceae bacterium]|nr:DNA polymerase III subunit delta [Chitinophagaceae bacterium]
MKADNIIDDLKKEKFKPVYWLEGEEDFFIDEIIDFAEHHVLKDTEAGFNLTVFYGRDTNWPAIINACRRYPMFAQKQVVIIKEAQAMKEIDKLEAYVNTPLSSTILFIAYKGKKIDGRTKLAKTVKENGILFTTRKLYDNEIPGWCLDLVKSKDLSISNKALSLLIDHIGNDLNRISNEIEKITINLGNRKNITDDDIENYIGISKEFNLFELQDALGKRDLYKAIRIAQYFENNPKAAPIQLIFPSLYSFFSKLQMIYTQPSYNEKVLATAIGVTDWKIKEYMQAARRYSTQSVEKNLLLLHKYNLKSIGINDGGTPDGMLLKEMIVKMIQE